MEVKIICPPALKSILPNVMSEYFLNIAETLGKFKFVENSNSGRANRGLHKILHKDKGHSAKIANFSCWM